MKCDEKAGLWETSAKTHIQGVCDWIEKLFDIKLKPHGSPLEKGDHPEMDDADLLVGDEITKCQMLLWNWMCPVGSDVGTP